MSHAPQAARCAMKRNNFRIHEPLAEPAHPSRWLINGFPVSVLIWTAEEWDLLIDRPLDAHPYPNGIWCALRMD
jgi:hypothetical protein